MHTAIVTFTGVRLSHRREEYTASGMVGANAFRGALTTAGRVAYSDFATISLMSAIQITDRRQLSATRVLFKILGLLTCLAVTSVVSRASTDAPHFFFLAVLLIGSSDTPFLSAFQRISHKKR
jgi:hypothetical protein